MGKNEILEKLEEVEALRNAYKLACENRFENSDYAINAFHEWYLAAVELFCEVLGEDDQLLQKFRTTDISGNGFTLRDVYRSLSSDYISLKVRVKNFDKQNGKNEISGQAEIGMQMVKIKPKKIFISHSKADEKFAHALILLLNSLGFGRGDIFCSSEKGYWVEKGKFIDVIKEQFELNDLYVIFIQSPRFYERPVTLNEMGAAWVLHSEYYSFLTKDMEYTQMIGVVDNQDIACKVNTEEARGRLNDWQRHLLEYFGKQPVADWSIWESNRDMFLKTVRRLSYAKKHTKEKSQSNVEEKNKLTDGDEELLKMWLDSGNDRLHQAWEEGGSAIFSFGAKYVFPVEAGPEMKRWREFFARMLNLGLIENNGYTKNGKHPEYRLTEKAYEYFD